MTAGADMAGECRTEEVPVPVSGETIAEPGQPRRVHPGIIVLGVPCLAAAITASVAIVEDVLQVFRFPARAGIASVFVNLAIAAIGAAAGGLSVRGSTSVRVLAAIGSGLVGVVVYVFALRLLIAAAHALLG